MRDERWFKEGLFRRVGDGENTSLKIDLWLAGGLLRSKFSYFFYLYVDSSISVAENMRLVSGLMAMGGSGGRGSLHGKMST